MVYREGQFDPGGAGADDDQVEALAGDAQTLDDRRPRGDEALDRPDRQRVFDAAGQVRNGCHRTGVDREHVEGQLGAVVAANQLPGGIDRHRGSLLERDAAAQGQRAQRDRARIERLVTGDPAGQHAGIDRSGAGGA